MQLVMVCNHLMRNIEIPCYHLKDPNGPAEDFTGDIYFCQECGKHSPEETLHPDNLRMICPSHCDAMTLLPWHNDEGGAA